MLMLGPFSIDTYLPAFPDIEAEFGVSRAALSQTLAVYLIAFAATTLVWGPLADSLGRRRVVLATLATYVAASIGCALAPSFDALLLMRLLQGLVASGGMVIGRAMIRDVYHGPHAQRVMSLVMLVFALAPAVAPVIGGWLHALAGWRAVFWFLAGHGLFVLLLAAVMLRETLSPDDRQSLHPRHLLAGYARALAHRRFIALVLAIALWFGGMFLYIAGAPSVIFEQLGLGAQSFAVQFVPMVVGLMLGSATAARFAHRWPPARTIDTALALMGLAAAANLLQALLLPPAPWNVIAPLVLYAFGVALAMPSLTVLALDCFPRARGLASAVQGFVQMGSNALVAAALVPLVAAGAAGGVVGFAVAQALLLLLAWRSWRRAVRLDPPG